MQFARVCGTDAYLIPFTECRHARSGAQRFCSAVEEAEVWKGAGTWLPGPEVEPRLTRRVLCPLKHTVLLLFDPLELLLTLQQRKRLLAKTNASSKNTISRVGTAKEIILTWQGERERAKRAEMPHLLSPLANHL